MTPTDRASLLATALRSPAAARARDRTGWLELFTADGTVIDPVGSRPHTGRAALGRFYDTFIGPREVSMSSDLDVVAGNSVFRDARLAVGMSTSVSIDVPAILRYDLAVEHGELRISRLRAYWELLPMVAALGRKGLPAAGVGAGLGAVMLRNQGVGGTVGFLRAIRPGGPRRVAAVRDVVDGASRLTVNGDVGATLCGARIRKTVAAGTTVAAVLDHDEWSGFLFAEFSGSRMTSVNVVTQPAE